MRFPRNTKIFRGQMDFAPLAGVLFLLVIFLLLNSSLVFVPGVPIQLPQVASLPGIGGPTIVVAVDESGQFYFDNQVMDEGKLSEKLREVAAGWPRPAKPDNDRDTRKLESRESLTLVIMAHAEVKYNVLTRLWVLARDAGITNVLQATQSPLVPTALPAKP